MSYVVPRLDENARRRPSGDQTGRISGDGLLVNLDALSAATPNIQISGLGVSISDCSAAMRLPSGEILGWRKNPAVVMARSSRPRRSKSSNLVEGNASF